MKKVVHVYPQLMCGGTETVFYSLIKASDHSRFKFDILVQRQGQLDANFKKIGCNIITIPFKSEKQYHKALKLFFTEHTYQVVHCHMHGEMPIVLEEAQKAGVPHCISHSHNARIDIPQFLWPLRYFLHKRYEQYATDLFGCSELALKWLFPRRWKEGVVVSNGIDLDAFQFNPDMRNLYRAKLRVSEETKVVINVGRCTNQKNQNFILDRAKELIEDNMLFLIIGEGPLIETLSKRIKDENLTNVRMLGKQLDVPNWLCAADIFMFPSIYEGLGIVAIEAQANGLPVLSTDSIPAETDMHMGSFHRISLKDHTQWNYLLRNCYYPANVRKQKSVEAYNSKYNIKNVAKQVEEIYMK